jgi:hypothetical protein
LNNIVLSRKQRLDLDKNRFTTPPTPTPSIQYLLQNKDSIDECMQWNMVYSVICEDCQLKYVGETDRQTIGPMKEHGAPSTTFEQLTKAEDKLRKSSPIRSKKILTSQNYRTLIGTLVIRK